MSRRPASARAAAETLPECEPPRMQVRGADHHRDAVRRGRRRRPRAVVGNSAMRAPWPAEAATWAAVASSWLASVAPRRRAPATAAASWRAPLRGAESRQAGDVGLELGLVHAAAAGGVVAQLGDVGELALAGGVVHQADDADAGPRGRTRRAPRRGSRSRSRRAGAAGGGCAARRRARRRLISVASGRAYVRVAGLAAGDQRADAQRVEDGGDAGAGELGVVGEDGRRLGPAHAGARLEVALEIVGVELDQAGGEDSRRRSPRRRRRRAAPVSIAAMRPSRSARLPVTRLGLEDEAGVGEHERALLRRAEVVWHGPAHLLGDHHGRLAAACNLFRTARGQRAGALRGRLARLGRGGGRAARGPRPARAAAAARGAGRGAAALRLPRHAEAAVPPGGGARRGRRSTPRSPRSRRGCAPFELRLRLAALGGFLALVPEEAPAALAALAEALRHRARRRSARRRCRRRLARRRVAGLDAVEEANLRRWGYPYVLRPLPLPHDADRAAAGRRRGPRCGRRWRRRWRRCSPSRCRWRRSAASPRAADGAFRLVRRFPLAGEEAAPREGGAQGLGDRGEVDRVDAEGRGAGDVRRAVVDEDRSAAASRRLRSRQRR